ncbi:MAG: nickel pincer cofactor biosynthesis protein LarB [Fimbriimonadales bacterium]
MTPETIREILQAVAQGTLSPDTAYEQLRNLPFESLGFAHIDHHRALRKGFPEVVFCSGKTPQQVAEIVARLAERGLVLATRAEPTHYEAVRTRLPQAVYHPQARAITLGTPPEPPELPLGLVITAGTADIPVAEEALLTARMMGVRAEPLYDVGVAGIHRLLAHHELLTQASAMVVVAGMEGALASVVGGLVACPVIAVPTSVGYGAHWGGLAPLLTMLNTCAPGVSVVNIDNGFGAGYCLAQILRIIGKDQP